VDREPYSPGVPFTVEALTLNPSPILGEGLKISLAPLLPFWGSGLGAEGLIRPSQMHLISLGLISSFWQLPLGNLSPWESIPFHQGKASMGSLSVMVFS